MRGRTRTPSASPIESGTRIVASPARQRRKHGKARSAAAFIPAAQVAEHRVPVALCGVQTLLREEGNIVDVGVQQAPVMGVRARFRGQAYAARQKRETAGHAGALIARIHFLKCGE